jgi:hypothetical protein
LSRRLCSVERFAKARRSNGCAGFATPESEASASMSGALLPTLISGR